MADTTRQRLEKRINNINKREKKRGTPQAKIDRQTKLYRDQLAKLPTRVSPGHPSIRAKAKAKAPIASKDTSKNKKKLTSGSVRKPTDRLKQVNINPPRANTSSATSVRKPVKKLKQPNANKKPKEQNKNKESEGFSFFTPKGRKLLNRIKKLIGPDKTPTTQNIKKALSSDGTYTQKQRDSLKEALKIRSPGHPSNRAKAKAPVASKDMSKNKKVDQSSYTKPQPSKAGFKALTTESPLAKVKKKRQTAGGRGKRVETANQANNRLSKARPTNQPSKKAIVSKRTQEEKDAGAGKFTGGGRTQQEKDAGAGKFTAKKSTKKSTSLPPLLNNSIAKEIIKSHGGEPAFKDKTNISSKIGRALGDKSNATQKMNNVVYNKLADEYNNDSGQMSEARKNLYFKMKNAKSGGQVRKRKGGMIKRNMGGPAKPRKKTVFRRGGGQALRGFGKATYSNKMY